jgi:hypothetical protein
MECPQGPEKNEALRKGRLRFERVKHLRNIFQRANAFEFADEVRVVPDEVKAECVSPDEEGHQYDQERVNAVLRDCTAG